MSDIEWAFAAIVWVFILFKIIDGFIPDAKPWKLMWDNERLNNMQDNSNFYKKIDNINLVLESLLINKEELENEIHNLEMNCDIGSEDETSTKIKKLYLKIKHLDIKIEKKHQEIYDINMKIQWI